MLPDDPQERIAWVQSPAFGGWEYLIAHNTRHLWTVYHETYTVCASRLYGQSWAYRGRRHTLSAPGMMLIEPGELHRTITILPTVSFKVAIIPPKEVMSAAQELGVSGVPHFRDAHACDPKLNAALLRLGDIAETGDGSLLEIQSRQADIVRRLLNHIERPPSRAAGAVEHRAVALIKDRLRSHLDAAVTLDELAAVSGLSRYRLVRTFTQSVGIPPHAYHLQLRVAKARQLLRQGMSGAEAASELGFADQAHFIRHFKKVLQVTPGNYAGQ